MNNGADSTMGTTLLVVMGLDLSNGPDLAMGTTLLVVMELATDMVAKWNALVHWCGRGVNGADLAVLTNTNTTRSGGAGN